MCLYYRILTILYKKALDALAFSPFIYLAGHRRLDNLEYIAVRCIHHSGMFYVWYLSGGSANADGCDKVPWCSTCWCFVALPVNFKKKKLLKHAHTPVHNIQIYYLLIIYIFYFGFQNFRLVSSILFGALLLNEELGYLNFVGAAIVFFTVFAYLFANFIRNRRESNKSMETDIQKEANGVSATQPDNG